MSNKIINASITSPSLAFLKIQASLVTGAPIVYDEKSTINEHMSILRDTKPLPMDRPLMNYLVVGQKGHTGELDDDGIFWALPVSHQPLDSAPYLISPLVVRDYDDDLTEEQRKGYCLRVLKTWNGKRYWAYYGKRLPVQSEPAVSQKITVQDGVTSINPLIYTDSNLYPQPPAAADSSLSSTNNVNVANPDGQSVRSFVLRHIEFNDFDTAEYIHAALITRNNPLKAVISEIIPCTGVDRVITVDSGDGSTFQFNEVIGMQPAFYISCYHNLAMANTRVAYNVEVGQTKPMKIRAL